MLVTTVGLVSSFISLCFKMFTKKVGNVDEEIQEIYGKPERSKKKSHSVFRLN